MTPELIEFRKWNMIAGLVERLSKGTLEPVVLTADGIGMLIIHDDKAFFFSSNPNAIIFSIETADTGEMIACATEQFSTGTTDCIPLSEIAHLAVTKILE